MDHHPTTNSIHHSSEVLEQESLRKSEEKKLDDMHHDLKQKYAAKVLLTKTPSVSTASDPHSNSDPAEEKRTSSKDLEEILSSHHTASRPSAIRLNSRKSRNAFEHHKNHMRHRVEEDLAETSSDSEDDNYYRHGSKEKSHKNSASMHKSHHQNQNQYPYANQSPFGIVPMQTMAFTPPFVAGFGNDNRNCESSDDSSSSDCLGGYNYDAVEDGVEFFYKPKSTGRTEFTVTVEPKKQPWLSMMKCGFKPVLNCMAPPAYLVPPNPNTPVPPQKNNCGNFNQCQNPSWIQYNNNCCHSCNYNMQQPYRCTQPGQASNINSKPSQGYYHKQHVQSYQSGDTARHSSMGGMTAVVSKIEDIA